MQKILKIILLPACLILASCGEKESSAKEEVKEVISYDDSSLRIKFCSKDFLEEYNKLVNFCGTRDLSERLKIEACIIQYETMDKNYPDLKCQAETKHTATPLILTKFALNDVRGDYTREKYLASTNKANCGFYVARDVKNAFQLCKTRAKECALTAKRALYQYPDLNCMLVQDNKESAHVTYRDLEKLLK